MDFPKNSDFISEGDDISDNVDLLTSEIILPLMEKPVDEYDAETNDFLENELPRIWKTIVLFSHPSRGLSNKIMLFIDAYCQLCFYTNLIPSMISAISWVLNKQLKQETVKKDTQDAKIEELSKDKICEIFNSVTNDDFAILLPPTDRPVCGQIIASLLIQIIQSKIFLQLSDLYDQDELPIPKISPMIQVFSCIASSLSQPLVSAILLTLFNIIVDLFNKQNIEQIMNKDTDLSQICKFLANYTWMLSNEQTIDKIFSVLCKMTSQTNQVKTILSAVQTIIRITETAGFANSAQAIKTSIVNVLNTSSQSSILNSIYDFLPTLSSKIQFNNDDLLNLLKKSRNGDEKLVSSMVDIVNLLKGPIDPFSQELLNYELLSPALYCSVIGKTEDESISRKLFQNLLMITDKILDRKEPIAHVELNERLQKHMSEDGVNLIQLLTFLFLCAPDPKTITDFILRVFDLPELPEGLITMLSNFTRKLNDFNSAPTIIAVFNVLFRRLKQIETSNEFDEHYREFTNKLISVVTDWIRMSKKIDSTAMLKQLTELDFSRINDNVPRLINELIEKSSLAKNNQNFLFKVLKDTVPPKHSNWLVKSIFDLIHHEETFVKAFFDVIISILEEKEENRYINGIYLLFEAVKYEADFFMLGDSRVGFVQNVILHLEDDNATELTMTFNPFHSTRRLYAEVGHALNINTDLFQLIIGDENDAKIIKYGVPLITIPNFGVFDVKIDNGEVIYKESQLSLKIIDNNEETKPNPVLLKTPFLDLLMPKVSLLFDLIDYNWSQLGTSSEYEMEKLFLIAFLFPQLNIEPKNAIQEILVGKSDLKSVMMFKDYRYLFPYAVSASVSKAIRENEELNELKSILLELTKHRFEITSLCYVSKSLLPLNISFEFDDKELTDCYFNCPNQQIRTIITKFISNSSSHNAVLSLVPLAIKKENRTKTKAFFECFEKLNISKETLFMYYEQLEQFEFSYYSEIDQTFISLLSLIPQTKEMVSLTIDRLFSPPSCRCEFRPFVQTPESWIAALKFIESDYAIPRIHDLLSSLDMNDVDFNDMQLSSDFTYKGRIGIVNMKSTCYMNSLLQVINSFPGVTTNLLSKLDDCKNMTPFVLELRNCLARLKYSRGTTLALDHLAFTIDSNFDPNIQQDIEEFFDSVLNKINEDLKEEDNITNLMKIEISSNFDVNHKTVSSSKENYFYLPLQTKGLANLYESFELYFQPDDCEYNYEGKQTNANHWYSISKWPDYLVIQLQRWDYKIETMERPKLFHEFQFPVELKGSDILCHFEQQKIDSDYTLTGVVIHRGTADQGHYHAIVVGEDNEWYSCDDETIAYFDINRLDEYAFGKQNESNELQTPEDVDTGYLLFYKKVVDGTVHSPIFDTSDCHLPSELEQTINTDNTVHWPSIIFYSEDFVNYAKSMILKHKDNDQMFDIALTCLFQIAPCDSSVLIKWCHLFNNKLFNSNDPNDYLPSNKLGKLLDRFFDFIEEKVGSSLDQLFSISDDVTTEFTNLIKTLLSKYKNSTKPYKNIFSCLPDQTYLKKMFCSFLFDIIIDCCQNTRNLVDWSKEDQILTMMLNIVSAQLTKEIQRQLTKPHIAAINSIFNILIDNLRINGCNETIMNAFDIGRLNKINYILKKSDAFSRLLIKVKSIQPDFLVDTNEATPATIDLLAQILPSQNTNEVDTSSNEQLDLDLDFMFESIEKLIFSDDEQIRNDIKDVLIDMIGQKDINIILYMKDAIIDNNLIPPSFREENTVALFVLGLLPHMNQFIDGSNENICYQLTDVLLRIILVSPNVMVREFRSITELYLKSKDEILRKKLFKLIHHLIAFDRTIIENAKYADLIDGIINSRIASPYSAQLLSAFKEKANESDLASSSVHYYLVADYDENAELLINLFENGLQLRNVEIPKEANDFMKLKLSNKLWDVILSDQKAELAQFMLSALHHAKPFGFYKKNSKTLETSLNLLEEFCSEELHSKIDQIEKEQEKLL